MLIQFLLLYSIDIMRIRFYICFLALFAIQPVSGQEKWSLLKCIEQASKNNLALVQSGLNIDLAKVDVTEKKHGRFPNLNARSDGGISFGRNVDPTTNSFTTEDILFFNYSLSSSVVLFQSGLMRNSLKQSKMNHAASQLDYQQGYNDLALSVASFYLNVLLAQDRLDLAQKNLEIINLQLDQIDKLIKAGIKPEADALEIKSQLARTEQSLVLAENAVDLAFLQLKQSMRMPPAMEIELERLTEEQLNGVQMELYTIDELTKTSYAQQPSIQSARIRLDAAQLGEKMARALYYPSVFMSGSIGSRFSDAAIRPKEYGTRRITVPGVYIDDSPVKFEQDAPSVLSTEVTPFATQFDQFLGYGVGLSVNIPIYENYRTAASVQRAKINSKISELALQQKKEELDQNIYTAVANVKAAEKEREAANKAYIAESSSFEKTRKKFEIGSASNFELNLAMTNLHNSETSLLMAKYDLIFKQKVLDYFAGKQIKL